MKLNDAVIAHIAKLIQLGILTGTDIVDHLRMLQLTLDNENNTLALDPEYEKNANNNIMKMISDVENLKSE